MQAVMAHTGKMFDARWTGTHGKTFYHASYRGQETKFIMDAAVAKEKIL